MDAAVSCRSPKRHKEFIAVRAVLERMLPGAVIGYNAAGKPYLLSSPQRISISHTADVVAVLISRKEEEEVGIDVEQYGERVCRVAPRFVGETEQADGVWQKLLLWSAKETVYKMMNCREVDFREHLVASDWKPDRPYGPGCRGTLMMRTLHPDCRKTFKVCFEIFPDFVLTYSCLAE